MKTGFYIRVSTGIQAIDGYSLDDQKDLCYKKSLELHIKKEEIEVYREEGVSGEDLDRPALNRLRSDVQSGLIERLVCVHPDRLSRDLTDKLLICRELEKFNVELIFVDTEYKNTPEGQLFFNMQSSIAQYELALIRKRTTRGRLQAVRKEKKIMPMRVAPFGYDLIDSKLIINKEEASIVNKIYEWYVFDKLTLREIGEKLYYLGIEPKRKESKNWGASSIRRVLSSEIYIGKYYYNKRKSKKIKGEKTASGNPKKSLTLREPKDWIVIDIPPIVDVNIFNLAQEQKVKNTKKSGNQKFEYLLKSILKCGDCGRVYQATTYSGRMDKKTGKKKYYPVYRCPNLFPKKYGPEVKRCKSRSIRADEIEIFIWNLILNIIYKPEDIIEEYKNNFKGSVSEINTTIDIIKKNLNNKKKERERVKQMFVRGFINEEEMSEEFKKVNSEISELEKEQLKYEKFIEDINLNAQDKKQFHNVLSKIEMFIDISSDLISFKEKRFILESLIEEIYITFNENLMEGKIKIIGAASDILSEATNCIDLDSCLQYQKI